MTSEPVIVIHKHEGQDNTRPDSIEIGTPSKGGALKIYFDANNVKDAKERVANAFIIKSYAGDLQECRVELPKTLNEVLE